MVTPSCLLFCSTTCSSAAEAAPSIHPPTSWHRAPEPPASHRAAPAGLPARPGLPARSAVGNSLRLRAGPRAADSAPPEAADSAPPGAAGSGGAAREPHSQPRRVAVWGERSAAPLEPEAQAVRAVWAVWAVAGWAADSAATRAVAR